MKQFLLMVVAALGVVMADGQIVRHGKDFKFDHAAPYWIYSVTGQVIGSGVAQELALPQLPMGIYILKWENQNLKLFSNGTTIGTDNVSKNVYVAPIGLPLTSGDTPPVTPTTDSMVSAPPVGIDQLDSMDISFIADGHRSLPYFTYCDSIDLNRRDLPPLQDLIDYFFSKADSLQYDWQKYELAAALVYRICDFKGSTPSAAIDGATWAAMSFEEKYEFCRLDSGNLLCWYRAKMLEQFLHEYFNATDMVIVSYTNIHTFLIANTSAGPWLLDGYFANNFVYEADAVYATQYLPATQRTKYYPNFLALLRTQKDHSELIKSRNIPRIFGSADNLKDAIPVLQYPCPVVKQYLDTITPAANPFCDTCFGYNIAEWMPSHFFLTDLSSQLNLKELDQTNYFEFAANPANLPYGYTGSNLYTYTTNGVDLTPSVYATSQWPTTTINEIKTILGIP